MKTTSGNSRITSRARGARSISVRTPSVLGLRRLGEGTLLGGIPTMAEVYRRLAAHPGFFASLTPEQWRAIREYDGPEVLGPGDGPRLGR